MELTEFCDHLYDESTDGYIQILKLDDKQIIKVYNAKNEGVRHIVEELHKEEDVFLAPNTMYIPRRRVENIRQFRALFQDIDCESKGLEKAKWLFEEFGGTSVYFPTEKMIYKEARDRDIISEYNGFNHKELATKYNMSESYIRAIINRHKQSA
ncbi:Mor transcription activator family protein [Romboutsia lituseburensis]|uniref:Mor transcription activator family protein n=1 Tax=Romboutsia lituseburensis TaxID=1537 RepID=UPI00215ADC39|nr:Mor transcription activator family protein [Romboutsia lituseburensis]MCR8747227.1 hypothetical protein [Romboutsia lituseburensis]